MYVWFRIDEGVWFGFGGRSWSVVCGGRGIKGYIVGAWIESWNNRERICKFNMLYIIISIEFYIVLIIKINDVEMKLFSDWLFYYKIYKKIVFEFYIYE